MLALAGLLLVNCSGPSKDAGAKLEKGFQNPPESAKSRVWWHWMNGNITTPGGMTYRILVLDQNSRYMSLPVLRKIRDMVIAGAIVSGPKPLNTPSLSDDPNEFRLIADQLWANENSVNTVGKGKVYAGQTMEEVVKSIEIVPDFEYTMPQESTSLLFVHRKLGNAEFYWVNNRNNRVEELEAAFRVKGKSAEIWHPETGKIEQASYIIDVWLDLGEVKNLAEVLVNGKSLGIIWKKPFRVDVTDVLKPGENTLDIRVTNLWVNRPIGDQQPGITTKYSYTTQAFYRADSPLLPSGLLGPVQVETGGSKTVKVSYDVYAFRVSVGEPFLDDGRAFIAPAGVFMYVEGKLHLPCTLTVNP